MIKFLSTIFCLLFAANVFAGLPPTTSKVSGDSNNVTTFNFQFPNFTGTHTGTTVSLGVNGIAGGGTNNGSLAVTAGGVLYTDGSKVVNVGAGTTGQYLKSNGSSAPSWTTTSPAVGTPGAMNTAATFAEVSITGTTYTTIADSSLATKNYKGSAASSGVTNNYEASFTLNAGTYLVMASNVLRTDTSSTCAERIFDGTTTIAENFATLSSAGAAGNMMGFVTYASPTTVTISVQFRRVANGTACYSLGGSGSGYNLLPTIVVIPII